MKSKHEHMGLEGRLSVRYNPWNAFLEAVNNGFKQVIRPYILIARHPETPFYALGNVVKNVAGIPFDFYHYLNREGISLPFDKKVSRSLALGEAVAFYGARNGAYLIGHFSDNRIIQATAGGFIGSEVTTAAVFFLTYVAFSSVVNLRADDERNTRRKLSSALVEAFKVSLITIPAGLASFASADLGIASLAVMLGSNPRTAATVASVAGSALYSGTANAAVRNGYSK